jgi:hypothetical protein
MLVQMHHPILPLAQNIFLSIFQKLVFTDPRPASIRGAFRDRHER